MREYIKTPITTSYTEIVHKDFSLSATQHKHLMINNLNTKELKELLSRDLVRSDLGYEIGSDNYISNTGYFFIKTKALQEEFFTISDTNGSFDEMNPNSHINIGLKKGDILISKDSNVGEVIILDKDYPKYMLSSALYRLPLTKNKYYILAFIKSDLFRQQIDFMVPRGSTIRHGKTMFLDCNIPFPNSNIAETMDYVEFLTEAIINKEVMIKNKHQQALNNIQFELEKNQSKDLFKYSVPTINEIFELDRMDSCLYSKDFKEKEFLIRNYKYGTKNVSELGFKISRGQNLQVSNIGKSIQKTTYSKGFYKLMLPMYLTKYGTTFRETYLGNTNNLKLVKKGDIIFGAEGNDKGRSIAILDDLEPTITNIHGITLKQKKHDVNLGVFIKLMLDYYRDKGLIDLYAVGGNGGSLAIKYWDYIKIPNFETSKIKDITSLYHTPANTYDVSSILIDGFKSYDNEFNSKSGINEIDKSMKYLKTLLDEAINNIIDDVEVKTPFKTKETN